MFKNITFLLLLPAVLFSNDLDIYEFHFHGNFCGADLPLIKNKTKAEELKILKQIVPIDLIDLACKNHDICYLDSDTKSSVCDQRLVLEIKSFHNNIEDRSCRRLSKSIRYFFTLKTENPITVTQSSNSVKEKMFIMPAVTFSNMMSSASMASVIGVNYIYRKPRGYLFDSENNGERRKEILQFLPKRFKVCTVKQ